MKVFVIKSVWPDAAICRHFGNFRRPLEGNFFAQNELVILVIFSSQHLVTLSLVKIDAEMKQMHNINTVMRIKKSRDIWGWLGTDRSSRHRVFWDVCIGRICMCHTWSPDILHRSCIGSSSCAQHKHGFELDLFHLLFQPLHPFSCLFHTCKQSSGWQQTVAVLLTVPQC